MEDRAAGARRTARDAWAKPSVRRPRARETPSDDLGRWHRRPKCERRERRTRFERKCNNWRTTSRGAARALAAAPPRQRSERWTTLWDSLNRIKPNLRARATSFTLETANWRTRDEICERARRARRRASRTRRLESENADLALKVSSLEEVLGDVGGHKRNIMILRGRVTHLTSEIQRAKECTAAKENAPTKSSSRVGNDARRERGD